MSHCPSTSCFLRKVVTLLLFTPKLPFSQKKKDYETLSHLVSGKNHPPPQEGEPGMFQTVPGQQKDTWLLSAFLVCLTITIVQLSSSVPPPWGCPSQVVTPAHLSAAVLTQFNVNPALSTSIWSQRCDQRHRTDGEMRQCCIAAFQGGCLQQV